MSLTDRLANLQVLLHSKSFARWPLNLQFFSEDVFLTWERWIEIVGVSLRKSVSIGDPAIGYKWSQIKAHKADTAAGFEIRASNENKAKSNESGDSRISTKNHYDTDYAKCYICSGALDTDMVLTLICPLQECQSKYHIACLSKNFLEDTNSEQLIMPTIGNCPHCLGKTAWIDLIKGLSVRTHRSECRKANIKSKNKSVVAFSTLSDDTDKIEICSSSSHDSELQEWSLNEGW